MKLHPANICYIILHLYLCNIFFLKLNLFLLIFSWKLLKIVKNQTFQTEILLFLSCLLKMVTFKKKQNITRRS